MLVGGVVPEDRDRARRGASSRSCSPASSSPTRSRASSRSSASRCSSRWSPAIGRSGSSAAVTAVLVLVGRRRVRGRQGRRRLDPTCHERPLAADRPDGAGLRPAPARRRRPRLTAAREPGALDERRPAVPLRLPHDAAHGRGRARPRRARALRRAPRRRGEGAPARVPARGRVRARARRGLRSRSSSTRCSTAASSRTPSRGSCSESRPASSPRGRHRGRRRRHERAAGSTAARHSACSACSVCSSRSTSRRSAPTPGPSALLPSSPAACSARSSAPPTAAGTSASCAPRPCSPACSSRPRDRRLAGGIVAPGRARRALRRRRRARHRSRDAAPGRAARRVGAVVPHERLDVPDRARRQARAARAHARTATTTRARGSSGSTAATAACRRPPRTRRSRSTHFAYFPGTALTAAAWSFVPSPFDDYRVLVLLATIGCFFAVLLFDAPLPWRLAVGAAVAASPLLVRGAWFGTADATGILALLLAFGLLTRSRYVWAARRARRRDPPEAVRARGGAVLRRHAARPGAPAGDARPRAPPRSPPCSPPASSRS